MTESIWIGKMNYIASKNISYQEKIYFDKIRNYVCKENLQNILKTAKKYNQIIRIKDFIIHYYFVVEKDYILNILHFFFSEFFEFRGR